MNKYNDLECSILSCILMEPKLIETTILEDKHFINYQKIWLFMKSFYKKFKNFDFVLMCSVCKDKYKLMMYIKDILEMEPTTCNFKLYEKQLINLYEEEQKEKWLIKQIYILDCDLWTRNITCSEFKEKIEEKYIEADKLFNKNI